MVRVFWALVRLLVVGVLSISILPPSDDAWPRLGNPPNVHAIVLQDAPPQDLSGRWDGTMTFTSLRGDNITSSDQAQLNRPVPLAAMFFPSSQWAGKLVVGTPGNQYEPEGEYSLKDGRITASLVGKDATETTTVTLDGAVEVTNGGYVWRGNISLRRDMYFVKPSESKEGRGTFILTRAAKAQPTPVATRGAVQPTPRPMTAAFGYEPKSPKEGDSITFTDQSVDPAGGNLARTWYVDGAEQKGAGASWSWKLPDGKPHRVKLVVSSSSGAKGEVEQVVGGRRAGRQYQGIPGGRRRPPCRRETDRRPGVPGLAGPRQQGWSARRPAPGWRAVRHQICHGDGKVHRRPEA